MQVKKMYHVAALRHLTFQGLRMLIGNIVTCHKVIL
jgi:hypothetical protein